MHVIIEKIKEFINLQKMFLHDNRKVLVSLNIGRAS